MPIKRNFNKTLPRKMPSRVGSVVQSVTIVHAVDGHSFTCPICNEDSDEFEYLRIYVINPPVAQCVHSKCLVEFLRRNAKMHHTKPLYPRTSHQERAIVSKHGAGKSSD